MDDSGIDHSFWEQLSRGDFDWLIDAAKMDILDTPVMAASEGAAVAGPAFIVCPTIDSIPPGKCGAKVLKCGVPGCTSTKLFDRKYDLQRHMETHDNGRFPCTVDGRERGEQQPFKRAEHLRNHMKTIHGL